VSASATDRRIRSLRPPKPRVDPYTAHGSVLEQELRPNGAFERTLTVFLAGAECPFTCSFCDLWRFTIEGPTPPGALTAQLRAIVGSLEEPLPDRLKLYNASNFFDNRAVPQEDVTGIAALCAAFSAVTVESHVNTVGPRTLEFAHQIPGRLEVAIGLETIHPIAAERINKRLDLARFDSAAGFLSENEIDLRVFVLLGAPFVPAAESVDWTVRAVERAAVSGAAIVSIIPVREGNGEMERLRALGDFVPPTLKQLEETLDRCGELAGTVVTADLWDVERLIDCSHCGAGRVDRLKRVNMGARGEPRVRCLQCGSA
jgi:radical SAM enzyme (TIGR01210 family)